MPNQEKNTLQVLIIEDNPGDVALIKEYVQNISSPSYQMTAVSHLNEALACLKKNHFDVILLDLSLPDSQGIESIVQIKSLDRKWPIVVLTGFKDEKKAIEAVGLGAQDYLNKGDITAQSLSKAMLYAIERQKIEDQIYFQKSLLECQLDSSLEGILIFLSDHNVYKVNKRFLDMFKFKKESLCQWNDLQIFTHIKNMLLEESGFEKLIILNKHLSLEVALGEIQLKDGHIFEYYTAPVRGLDATYYGRSWSFSDITQKKRMEVLKDDFVSTVSHELRTPLAIVKGAISNLEYGIVGPLSEKQLALVKTTSRNVERLTRLINNLLDMARLESGKITVRLRRVDLKPILEDLNKNYETQIKQKEIQLVLDLPHYMMPCYADSDLLVQVLHNLIDNALRFAKNRIVIKCQDIVGDEKNQLQISIIDDGPGIEKTHQAVLFNKFEQIHRPMGGSGYKGTGLGLALCKEIIELHQGKIWMESEVGCGARFHFLIPQYDIDHDFRTLLNEAMILASSKKFSLGVFCFSVQNLKALRKNLEDIELNKLFEMVEDKIRVHCLRQTDHLFHYTLKDFLTIIPDIGPMGARSILNRIKKTIEECMRDYLGSNIAPHIAAGFAIYPELSTSPEGLIAVALQSMRGEIKNHD